MNKLCIIVLIMCATTNCVHAVTYELNWIKVYVDGEQVDEADESGGEITANPGQRLKIKWWMENKADRTLDYDVQARVFDIVQGDDLYVHENHEIEGLQDEVQSLDIIIPDDADEDVYDVVVEITGDNGDNITEQTIDYDLVIEELNVFQADNGLMGQCINTTTEAVRHVGDLASKLNETLSYADAYTNCTHYQGIYMERLKDYNKTCDELTECENSLETYKTMSVECDTKTRSMLTDEECTQKVDDEVGKQKNNMLMMGILGALVIFVGYKWNKQREANKEKPPGPRMPGRFT